MNIIFLSPADKEFGDAIVYYNDQFNGLGNQFYAEVCASIKFIQRFPQGWKKVGKHTRKCIINHFPYLMLYIAEENKIIITALAHQHRHPDYYLKRKNNI